MALGVCILEVEAWFAGVVNYVSTVGQLLLDFQEIDGH